MKVTSQQKSNNLLNRKTSILLIAYAVLCLIQIKVSIRWGGFTPRAIIAGTFYCIIFFVAPIIIAGIISAVSKKPFSGYFNKALILALLVCFLLVGVFTLFMLSFKFLPENGAKRRMQFRPKRFLYF